MSNSNSMMMELFMEENGKMANNMEKELKSGMMGKNTQENSKMTR